MYDLESSGIKTENKTVVTKTVEISIPAELISKIMIDWNTCQSNGNYGALWSLMEAIKKAETKIGK